MCLFTGLLFRAVWLDVQRLWQSVLVMVSVQDCLNNVFEQTLVYVQRLRLIHLYPVVKTRLQSLNKSANEDTYNGVLDCIRYSIQ